MNRRIRRWIVLLLMVAAIGTPLFADIQQSVLDLLTKLSRDYVQYREEIYFKVPLAVVPFVNSGPLAKQHEIGAVVDELIRSEIINSTYFILIERENLEQILEEIEFSLSDMADTSQTVEVGQLTSARILLAGSITESGSSFLLNGRLVDVERYSPFRHVRKFSLFPPYGGRGVLPSLAFSPDRRLDERNLDGVPVRGVQSWIDGVQKYPLVIYVFHHDWKHGISDL